MAKTIPNEEKVFMVSKSTNTTYSGSASLKAMQEWYTMEDVANTIKPYKVFTALLTQSGNYFLDQLDYSTPTQNVTKGVTYNISGDGGDFSNVGAPNNNDGTFFIAINNEIPNAWGNDAVALVYNTGAPVATVLENTIGNVWFTYIDAGFYSVESESLFTDAKTWVNPVIVLGAGGSTSRGVMYLNTGTTIGIITELDVDAPFDGILSNTPIEIRVYN
jgi:hypothetical protein